MMGYALRDKSHPSKEHLVSANQEYGIWHFSLFPQLPLLRDFLTFRDHEITTRV